MSDATKKPSIWVGPAAFQIMLVYWAGCIPGLALVFRHPTWQSVLGIPWWPEIAAYHFVAANITMWFPS